MRIAHLIMVHKNAEQVERLLSALRHEDADYYIHLDLKANMADYSYLAALPRVFFITNRISARWASFRFVEAIVGSVREALASGQHYDFINLLSGQDYPIKPIESIHKALSQQVGSSFMSVEPEGSPWWHGAIQRVEKYHSVYFEFKGQYQLQRLANVLLPKRRFPLPYTLYGSADGSWWTISADCAKYLVRFMEEHPEIRKFGRFTWGSDEFMIATILMNSPLKKTIINENYRYIDWSAGGANPKVLALDDADALARSPKWFARKFDVTYDTKILDYVDSMPHEQLHKNA
jgi:hypothetical protein